MMTMLFVSGLITNLRGVYVRAVDAWLKTAPSFSRAKILNKKRIHSVKVSLLKYKPPLVTDGINTIIAQICCTSYVRGCRENNLNFKSSQTSECWQKWLLCLLGTVQRRNQRHTLVTHRIVV